MCCWAIFTARGAAPRGCADNGPIPSVDGVAPSPARVDMAAFGGLCCGDLICIAADLQSAQTFAVLLCLHVGHHGIGLSQATTQKKTGHTDGETDARHR